MNKKKALVEFGRGNFKSAERILQNELRNNPSDLSSQLYLGLCKLFLNDEQAFKRIHAAVARKLARLESIPSHLVVLWSEYKRQFLKITATALVLGGPLSVTGCQQQADPFQPPKHGLSPRPLYGAPPKQQPPVKYGLPSRVYPHKDLPDFMRKQPSRPVTEPQPKAIPQTDSEQSKP